MSSFKLLVDGNLRLPCHQRRAVDWCKPVKCPIFHGQIFHNLVFEQVHRINFWHPYICGASFLNAKLVENSEHVNHIVISSPPKAFLYFWICLVLSCQRYLPKHTDYTKYDIHTMCWMVSCWIYILQYEHICVVFPIYIRLIEIQMNNYNTTSTLRLSIGHNWCYQHKRPGKSIHCLARNSIARFDIC